MNETQRFQAKPYVGTIRYSRGKHITDAYPEQRKASDFLSFFDMLHADRCDEQQLKLNEKGHQYFCGPLASPHSGAVPQRKSIQADPCAFLTGDCDKCPQDKFEPFIAILDDFLGCGYLTFSSTEDAPRFRFVLALSRLVDRCERTRLGEAFNRYVASRGFADVNLDVSVYKPEQACYLPVGNAQFWDHKGQALDVDALLTSEFAKPEDIKSKYKPETDSAQVQKDYAKPLLEDMATVLLYVDAEDEQIWSNTLNGIARTYGENGRFLAHEYSKGSDKYEEAKCDARYDRALEDLGAHPTGFTAWSIIKQAKENPDWPEGIEIRYESSQVVDGINVAAGAIKSPNQHIAEINETYAWDQKRLEIYSREARKYVNQSGFKTNYRTVNIPVGKNTFQSLGDYWLSSKNRLTVKGTRLAPDEGPITVAGEINTWLGYSCKPIEGDIQPFLDVFCHLLTNPDNRNYVMSFCAKLIQSPATRFNVALGIFGEAQGTGKNSIFEAVGGLLHEHHFKVISGAELDSPYDDWQIDKVFVVGDEVSNSGERTKADKLKRLVTATNNNINPKGFPGFSQPNLIKYVFLSNHDQILHIGEHDRRYYIAKTTEEKLPAEVADKFYAWKAKGGLAHLLYYLLNYDCSNFDPTKEAPMTEAKAEVIDAGKSSLELWVERYTSKLNTQGKTLITTDDVVTQYRVAQNQFATPKAAGNALYKAGAKKLARRAQFATGERFRVFAIANFEHLKGLSERELGSIWENENR